jgi:carbonic anhydrase
MRKLVQGIVEFRRRVRPEVRETFARLALGQRPDALFIACSDSRVAVNVFASTEPGDLFVVRNPGNIVSPAAADGRSVADESEAAAIEFAVDELQVKDIIVCGHSSCGAMTALLEGREHVSSPNLRSFLRHSEPALARLADPRGPRALDQLSQGNVLLQLEHLRTYPMVAHEEAAGRLKLHAFWFDIAQAEVLAWEAAAGAFVPLDEEHAERMLQGR